MRRFVRCLTGFAVAVCAHADPIPPGPIAESSESFGYPSVQAAMNALQKEPTVEIIPQQGWIIVKQRDDAKGVLAIWSFTPPTHSAHPAVVRRNFVQTGDAVSIEMRVLCEAPKEACDQLVRDFQALNDQLKARVSGAH